MGFIRSQVGKVVRAALARQGLELYRPEPIKFGVKPWLDISRLAETWDYCIETFLDVGANNGNTALAAAQAFPAAKIFSFEPHPGTFVKLQAAVADEPRIRAVNCALGSREGEVTMFEYDGSSTNSLTDLAPFAVRWGQKGRQIAVRSTTLDQYCREHSIERIDVLKIDTEGYDLVVLQSGLGMLERGLVSFVLVEFNDLVPKPGAFGGSLLSMDELLRPHGFRFIATSNDWLDGKGELFCVSNALFALPPVDRR